MKRCPQCNRVETDEALGYCRADGTALITDSGPVGAEAGTMKFGSAPVASEIESSVLPQAITDAGISRPTAQTMVLPAPPASSTTHELIKPRLSRVAIAIVLLITAAIAVGGYLYLKRKAKTAIQSIAVMPFVNASGNPDVEYLSDGITESLINSLSQLPNLSVKGRSTVFRYKGKDITPQQIGSELSVQAILNGRVVQRGEQLTLSLDLANARTADQIWGQQYVRKASDLVSLQAEIANEISQKLRTDISGEDPIAEAKRAQQLDPISPEQGIYLGQVLLFVRRYDEAVDVLQKTVELDETFWLSHDFLGRAYEQKGRLPEAIAEFQRAIQLEPAAAENRSMLGQDPRFADLLRRVGLSQ